MAKKSAVENNKRRQRLVAKFSATRQRLKKVISNRRLTAEDRFEASLKLAELPRNGAANRVRNRCLITGRPRGYYRKLRISRIAFRELASRGLIPGMAKSSW